MVQKICIDVEACDWVPCLELPAYVIFRHTLRMRMPNGERAEDFWKEGEFAWLLIAHQLSRESRIPEEERGCPGSHVVATWSHYAQEFEARAEQAHLSECELRAAIGRAVSVRVRGVSRLTPPSWNPPSASYRPPEIGSAGAGAKRRCFSSIPVVPFLAF